MKLTFWGVRGSIPTPGKHTIEYGGNTTCMEVRSQQNEISLVDAGSGIREAGNALMSEFKGSVQAKLFITHDHWDHIQGFPFFTPAYLPGCEISVYSGDKSLIRKMTAHGLEKTLEGAGNTEVLSKSSRTNHTKEVFRGQQDVEKGYFPVGIEQMGSTLTFYDLKQRDIVENGVRVSTLFHTAHPGGMFSYKFQENGKILVFTGDYEHDGQAYGRFGAQDERMIAWARHADALVIDAQYTPEEYEKKRGWGHSQIERVCELAAAANVKRLYITHHDPLHHDEQLHAMEERARRYAQTMLKTDMPLVFAREGMCVEV